MFGSLGRKSLPSYVTLLADAEMGKVLFLAEGRESEIVGS